jgi:hypothetical protein
MLNLARVFAACIGISGVHFLVTIVAFLMLSILTFAILL